MSKIYIYKKKKIDKCMCTYIENKKKLFLCLKIIFLIIINFGKIIKIIKKIIY